MFVKRQQRQQLLLLVALIWSSQAASSAALPFRVYKQCSISEGGVGLCRTDPSNRQPSGRSGALPAAATTVPKQLPVDMRFPCKQPQKCKKNVDVVRQPDPPAGADINSCSVSLMPWSAFPCAFDAGKYIGLPGQPTDMCYTNSSDAVAQELGLPNLATNLTTDGYNNLFYGVMPQQLCGGVEMSSVEALLLTVDFRLASGRQFDRTYSFQIGHAVAAFGTCSEPSRLIDDDKTWSTRVDISHLQPYIHAGMPTRFNLANVLSNTYNVPIWARVRLNVYFRGPRPSSGTQPQPQQQQHHAAERALRDAAMSPADPAAQSALTMSSQPSVPDEVLPLVPFGQAGMEALSVIGGDGDRPANWPNIIFDLPSSMSAARNIYRAQLRVVPKGNGCEEFWAMNPSGASTNNTCGGRSTGEPYREVRVYVDGQLAGFYPVTYTMYTGGVDPRLWTAIVAVNTYSLPVYTFDLSPWLGVLNNNAPNGNHTITVELMGASGDDWVLANTLLLWRDRNGIIVSGERPVMVMSTTMSEPVVSTCESSGVEAGACEVRLGERTVVVGSLLQAGDSTYATFVKYHLHHYANSIAYNNVVGSASWRQLTSHEATWFMGDLENYPRTSRHEDVYAAFVNIGQLQTSSLSQALHAYMFQQGCGGALTCARTQYDWLNAGGIEDGAVFEFSDNMTMLVPHTYSALGSYGVLPSLMSLSGQQRHYQRLLMVDVYNQSKPACVVPHIPTHTAWLNTTVNNGVHAFLCQHRRAACAFCSPELMVDEVDDYLDRDHCGLTAL